MELWIERGIFMWPCIGFCSLALLNPHGASAVPKGQWWLSNMCWITLMFCGCHFQAWMFTCGWYATDLLTCVKKNILCIIRERETKTAQQSTCVERKLLTCVNALSAFLHINTVSYKIYSTPCVSAFVYGTDVLWFSSPSLVYFFLSLFLCTLLI